ncbi:MAG: hypothetical protein KAS93_03575 [Gammaproteobacteria bacterium]|nr:hypothetical protein [Gammaproteobacteria bacterium]
MVTYLDCALLSGGIYHLDAGYMGHNFRSIRFDDITPTTNGWMRMKDVRTLMHDYSPFLAALYIKFEKGEAKNAVVAIRGTVKTSIFDLAVDAISWTSDVLGYGESDHLPAYMALATAFLHQARWYLKRYFPNCYNYGRITITGHSLGGAIAQLLSLTTLPYTSVVFNSPGCGHMIQGKTNPISLVHNIDATYGFINKIGETIGNLSTIEVPEQEQEAKEIFENINEQQMLASLKTYSEHKSDLKGLTERLKAYGNTVNTVSKFRETKHAYLKCEQENTATHWYELKEKLAKQTCGIEAILTAYAKVIGAQHSINNMLTTLMDERYRAFALRAIV